MWISQETRCQSTGTHMPDLVVQPTSTEEVAAVMKICYENTIPVTPRGAGTGLAGGAVPLLGGVLIDTSKMNRILNYDLENFVVEIESGVLLNDLANDCLSKGMMYPPDPGEKFAMCRRQRIHQRRRYESCKIWRNP